jgi:hypothetical protein
MQDLRYSLDITLASQAEDPPEYVRRAFSCWPPKEGIIEDAFAAQDHEVEDDNDEQLEDDEGVAAAEHEMESETVGHLDEGEGGPAEEAKSPAKSLVGSFSRNHIGQFIFRRRSGCGIDSCAIYYPPPLPGLGYASVNREMSKMRISRRREQ